MENSSNVTSSNKSNPTTASATNSTNTPSKSASNDIKSHVQYKNIVIDTNAIIKGSGLSQLRPSCLSMDGFYTVPGVFQEIVDKKAKAHLDQLPFQLISREPSSKSVKAVADFARLTGDYRELSLVDLHILALTYELEVLGCNGESGHLRTEPKRRLGGGRIIPLSTKATYKSTNGSDITSYTPIDNNSKTNDAQGDLTTTKSAEVNNSAKGIMDTGAFEVQIDECYADEEEDDDVDSNDDSNDGSGDTESETDTEEETMHPENNAATKSWAFIVKPDDIKEKTTTIDPKFRGNDVVDIPFGQMSLSSKQPHPPKKSILEIQQDEMNLGGQFSDAEEDDLGEDDYGIQYAVSDSDAEMSDEECDVYILDPEEVEERKRKNAAQDVSTSENKRPIKNTVSPSHLNEELNSNFPSLQAAATVPYEGSDDEKINCKLKQSKCNKSSYMEKDAINFEQKQEAKKKESLESVGKHWNSFRKDKHLVSSKGLTQRQSMKEWELEKERLRLEMIQERSAILAKHNDSKQNKKKSYNASRIMGGMTLAGQSEQVDDDGEGWVTVSNINSIKSKGIQGFSFKDQTKPNSNSNPNNKSGQFSGPDPSNRCACATTDFAMQNIILQMGMVLLSIDGVAVRKLKHWVTRCATCFTVYGGGDSKTNKLGGRLFCDKCGGSYLERVSASVDSKTGRYRLYLSKKRKNNKRGTKFSLPKPGKVRHYIWK